VVAAGLRGLSEVGDESVGAGVERIWEVVLGRRRIWGHGGERTDVAREGDVAGWDITCLCSHFSYQIHSHFLYQIQSAFELNYREVASHLRPRDATTSMWLGMSTRKLFSTISPHKASLS
jgi:hypothetical protein